MILFLFFFEEKKTGVKVWHWPFLIETFSNSGNICIEMIFFTHVKALE